MKISKGTEFKLPFLEAQHREKSPVTTMDSRYFSKDLMTEFIDTYRENPALWKIKSKEYTNKNLKNLGLQKLIEVFKKYNINADKDFVLRKIQSVRGSFRKELNKVKASLQSGATGDEVYIPSLWYYDLLTFTTEDDAATERVSRLEQPESIKTDYTSEAEEDPLALETNLHSEDTQECIADQEDWDNRETNNIAATSCPQNNPRRCRQRKRYLIDADTALLRACTATLNSTPPKVGEFEAVGINVAAKLAKMDQNQQIYAELLVQKVLSAGLLNKLNEETDLTNDIRRTL